MVSWADLELGFLATNAAYPRAHQRPTRLRLLNEGTLALQSGRPMQLDYQLLMQLSSSAAAVTLELLLAPCQCISLLCKL